MKPPAPPAPREGYRAGYLKLRSVLFDRNTALPAFPVLFDRLRALVGDRRELGVLHVEIANLDLVESLYGWQVFDRIVARAAAALREALGGELPGDALLAVNGVAGDRFVVFVPRPGGGDEATGSLLERAGRELQRRMERTFDEDDFRGLGPQVSFRIGHALLSENPFFRFERCVYAAVDEARGTHERRERRRELSWGEELGRIIQTDAIDVVFQPVVELPSRDLFGYEAFVRGPADTLFETPRAMFALSGRVGLDVTLDRACCARAVEQFARRVGGGKLFLNLLPESLDDDAWPRDALPELLGRQGLEPADVVVELSERRAGADPRAWLRGAERLAQAGFALALDDVGTGRLELAWIEQVRPRFLKLDASMVREIQENLIQQEMLATLCGLAERIGAAVVGEGVESEAEAETLAGGGARYAQGFLFAGPASRRWSRDRRRGKRR